MHRAAVGDGHVLLAARLYHACLRDRTIDRVRLAHGHAHRGLLVRALLIRWHHVGVLLTVVIAVVVAAASRNGTVLVTYLYTQYSVPPQLLGTHIIAMYNSIDRCLLKRYTSLPPLHPR